MPDTIGNITVPEIAASGTFPIVSEYPYGRASHPDVAIHQFGSGNAKIEQRFLLGTGYSRKERSTTRSIGTFSFTQPIWWNQSWKAARCQPGKRAGTVPRRRRL